MACELYDDPCDTCIEQYCPDQLDDLEYELYKLTDNCKITLEKSDKAMKELREFIEENKDIMKRLRE